MSRTKTTIRHFSMAAWVGVLACSSLAQEKEVAPQPAPAAQIERNDQSKPPPTQLVRLSKQDEIWIDRKNKTVIVGGQIALRKGPLEMFACPKQTKEHESVVSVNSKAFLVHAGLLAVGAKPGQAVQYQPQYAPAKGDEIEVTVIWVDPQGAEHKARAQDWVRDVRTGKVLEHPWVFAGSGFWIDEQTGRKYYQAEGGELICVSNFSTATLDLPIPSSQANESLLFEAFTERIPPRGTKVQLHLRPKKKSEQSKGTSSGERQKSK